MQNEPGLPAAKRRGRKPKYVAIPPDSQPERHTVQSVERTLTILEILAAASGPLGVSEIGARATPQPLHVSTVHRLLATLIERGYARQEPNGRYLLGPRLHELTHAEGQ